MTGEEEGGFARLDRAQEFLPILVETAAVGIVGADDLIAQSSQRLAERMGVVDGLLQLLLRRQIIVSIDANDKGDALGGRSGRHASNAAARHERKIVARRMASSRFTNWLDTIRKGIAAPG